jgi:nuclear pore complex protein Nup133
MFEKGSTVKPISPQDVLGAGATELDHRFNGLDAGMREEIMKDMQVEDDQLRPYIQRCRLEKWHQAAVDLAKQDFTAEVDDQTDDGKKMLKAADKLREIEKGIAENERSAAARLLHAAAPRRSKSRVDDGSSRTRRLRALR